MLGGSGLTPKFTPSFTFWTDQGAQKYQLEKAKEVMASVFTRRNRRWGEDDEALLQYVAQTAPMVEA